MQLDFLGQLAFRAQAIAVPNDEHPDHQIGINRRSANLAVIRLQLPANTAEQRSHKYIDAPEQVILRDTVFKPKRIKQACLIAHLPTHHRRLRTCNSRDQRNHCSATVSSLFRQYRSKGDERLSRVRSALRPKSDMPR